VSASRFFSLVHPDDRARVKASVEAAAAAPADFSLEFRLAEPERPPHFVSLRGLFLKSTRGDPLRAVGVALDITERRNADLRIIDSERRFRAVAERAPALIWSCDQGLSRDYVNKTWLSFTGRAVEQELGLGWQEGVPGVDLFRWQEIVGIAAAQRDPYSIEYRLRRADGALRWIIETGSPRLAADGSFAGYLGSCIDITARKENEAELEAHVRARTRELQSANQELETFSYSVSHDLRGPVRAIQGFAEIALEEIQAKNPDIAAERLQRVIRAAERMNKLIDAFISMARVSRAEMRVEEIDLSRMADEVIGFLRSTNPTRRVEVTITPHLKCHGDERLLRIVLENLIGNAWKFTAKKDDARIDFGAISHEGGRAFFVRDNGAGFDRTLAHKLFHAFERLHHTSQFEGLGVGLSTVHRVIEKHDGKVWAEGSEGEGATFYFTIPERADAGSGAVIEPFRAGGAA
jgi:PAS domain S-box-containing protein